MARNLRFRLSIALASGHHRMPWRRMDKDGKAHGSMSPARPCAAPFSLMKSSIAIGTSLARRQSSAPLIYFCTSFHQTKTRTCPLLPGRWHEGAK